MQVGSAIPESIVVPKGTGVITIGGGRPSEPLADDDVPFTLVDFSMCER